MTFKRASHQTGGAAGLVLICGVLLLGGCGIELSARRGGRGMVQGVAEGLAGLDPALRQRLHDAYFNDHQVEAAARDMARAVVSGAAEGIQQAQLDRLMEKLIAGTMAALRQQSGEMAGDLMRQTSAQLQDMMQKTLREAILTTGAALRESAQRDLSVATRAMVQSAVDATLDSISRYASAHAGDLQQPTLSYAQNALAPAAGEIMRVMMRDAMIGLNEGLESGPHNGAGLRSLMREIGLGLAEGMRQGATDNGSLTRQLMAGVGVLAALLLACLVGAFLLWRRYQRTTRSLVSFARKLSETKSADEASLRALRESLIAGPLTAAVSPHQDPWMRRFLSRRGLSIATSGKAPPSPPAVPAEPPPPADGTGVAGTPAPHTP